MYVYGPVPPATTKNVALTEPAQACWLVGCVVIDTFGLTVNVTTFVAKSPQSLVTLQRNCTPFQFAAGGLVMVTYEVVTPLNVAPSIVEFVKSTQFEPT